MNEKLLDLLRKRDNQVIKDLYQKAFKDCAGFVIKNNGTMDDAKETFQKGLFALLSNVQKRDFAIRQSLEGYLYGIVRNLWLKQLKKQRTNIPLDSPGLRALKVDEDEIPQKREMEEKYKMMYDGIKKLSEECRRMIRLKFFEKLSDKEIAPIMDYSEGFVRNKRRRCIQNLKSQVGKAS